jgi:predicted HTH transcriptional regulator
MIHPHSRASNKQVSKEKRREEILDALARENKPMTDRQIKNCLMLRDMNDVRPRISELIDAYKLKEVGRTKCMETGRTVRLVTLIDGGLF